MPPIKLTFCKEPKSIHTSPRVAQQNIGPGILSTRGDLPTKTIDQLYSVPFRITNRGTISCFTFSKICHTSWWLCTTVISASGVGNIFAIPQGRDAIRPKESICIAILVFVDYKYKENLFTVLEFETSSMFFSVLNKTK